ncbi:hypothetical protein [Aquimarina megaterium]|uniref:hypothetical protein n=1 Tax=Aquimarina megaterium TaxID=1443666 RepID=UPI0004701DAB|nr:hypothetical protein [Aquimarina megaterium]
MQIFFIEQEEPIQLGIINMLKALCILDGMFIEIKISPFTIEIKRDSLIQYSIEEIKEANIKKYIVEKYIKIK